MIGFSFFPQNVKQEKASISDYSLKIVVPVHSIKFDRKFKNLFRLRTMFLVFFLYYKKGLFMDKAKKSIKMTLQHRVCGSFTVLTSPKKHLFEWSHIPN